jgi:hypothetical protein
MRYVVIGLALASAIYILTGYAFAKGYEQGYVEGQERALMSPQALETCTKWWFDGNASRARQAMNQYCERNKK